MAEILFLLLKLKALLAGMTRKELEGSGRFQHYFKLLIDPLHCRAGCHSANEIEQGVCGDPGPQCHALCPDRCPWGAWGHLLGLRKSRGEGAGQKLNGKSCGPDCPVPCPSTGHSHH